MSGWVDQTTYSRSDEVRVPRVWTLPLPDLRIVVTRYIHLPGTWFLRCDEASFGMHDLGTDDVGTAKLRALRLVADRLAKIADYARNACEQQERGGGEG